MKIGLNHELPLYIDRANSDQQQQDVSAAAVAKNIWAQLKAAAYASHAFVLAKWPIHDSNW